MLSFFGTVLPRMTANQPSLFAAYQKPSKVPPRYSTFLSWRKWNEYALRLCNWLSYSGLNCERGKFFRLQVFRPDAEPVGCDFIRTLVLSSKSSNKYSAKLMSPNTWAENTMDIFSTFQPCSCREATSFTSRESGSILKQCSQ